ncbi:MAG: hypothetical protein AAFX45_01075 [Pseudomonadota bacterium]
MSKWAHTLDWTKNVSVWHLWIYAFGVFAVGCFASSIGCEDHLSRTGAIVVASVVGLFALDYRKDPEFLENLDNKYFPQRENEDEELLVQSSTVRAYFSEIMEARTFIRHEGYVLAIGTLVWGFGDLVVELFEFAIRC